MHDHVSYAPGWLVICSISEHFEKAVYGSRTLTSLRPIITKRLRLVWADYQEDSDHKLSIAPPLPLIKHTVRSVRGASRAGGKRVVSAVPQMELAQRSIDSIRSREPNRLI